MTDTANPPQRSPRAASGVASQRACLHGGMFVMRGPGIRNTLLVSSALCLGLGFSAAALPPTQNEASATVEAGWDVRRHLHDCARDTGRPARMCAAYVKARRSAEREVLTAPASVYWQEETRLRKADMKYAAALRRCSEVEPARQAACREAARKEIVQLWNESRRAAPSADADLTAARVTAVARVHISVEHPTRHTAIPFNAPQ